MNKMEKFCLKRNEFETNIRESFSNLREEQRLFDVTLATDDGQHFKAHKMILSAGSYFFIEIFMKSDQTNMLIYLKGISSAELKHVADFLYNGEASIPQEELKQFLDTANDLKVKGLEGYLQDIDQVQTKNEISSYQNNDGSKITDNVDSLDTKETTLEPVDKNLQLDTDDLELQIEQIQIEKITEE